MKGKIAFVLGAAVGYVLGTRAGRERYEQIKRGAQRLWNTDPIQSGVNLVKEAVDERADDLKGFAIRVGNDVFSNLAGKRSDPFTTTDEAAEKNSDSGESGTKSSSSSKSGSGSKSSSSKSSGSRSSGSKSKTSGGKAKS